MKMNSETAGWAQRYQRALRRCLQPGPPASLQPALRLGRRAVALGLETLDVVRIHERALATLASPSDSFVTRQSTIERGNRFFAEAIVPIEKTHRAALKADARVSQLTQTLHQRTLETSATTRHLKRGVVERQAVEAALKKSGKHRAHLLSEAHRLRKHLRHLTHEIMSAQEVERQKTSRQLHDEIAQTLLAIQVRLLTLRKAAKANTENLKKEIAETQRLVRRSAQTIHRLAHEFEGYHET